MSATVWKTFSVDERKEIDPEAGIYEAMISTEAVDRDGDVLVAAGARLENYLKNPIVLFGHNYFSAEAVVGRALEVEPIPGRGIRARWQFAPVGTSNGADVVRRLWREGLLNATSVGFLPLPNGTEKRTSDEGEPVERGRVFKDWELLEFSIVPIPSNQDALRLAAKSLGLIEDEIDEEAEVEPYVEELKRLFDPGDEDEEINVRSFDLLEGVACECERCGQEFAVTGITEELISRELCPPCLEDEVERLVLHLGMEYDQYAAYTEEERTSLFPVMLSASEIDVDQDTDTIDELTEAEILVLADRLEAKLRNVKEKITHGQSD